MTIAKCKKCKKTFATIRHIDNKEDAICDNCTKKESLKEKKE